MAAPLAALTSWWPSFTVAAKLWAAGERSYIHKSKESSKLAVWRNGGGEKGR